MKTRMMRLLAAVLLCIGFATPAFSSTYATTRYPVVLVHGLAGSSTYFGILDYWYGIPSDLRANGAYVYVADLSAFADEVTRGEELIKQIKTVLAVTGAPKVNLIGHSQGGMSARYAAAIAPTLVASVTTIGTPHKGSQVADAVQSLPPAVQTVVANVASALGSAISIFVNKQPLPQNPFGALNILSTSGAAAFNAKYVSAGVPATCSSATGTSDVRSGQTQLLYSWTGNQTGTNVLDITDAALVPFGLLISSSGAGANDGLVSVCSARFGKELGVYGWNHLDEVNQLFGLRGLFSADPVATIRTHVNRLKLAGV